MVSKLQFRALLNTIIMCLLEHKMTDLELRIWCAEQCRNNNGELNLEKMEKLYQFISSHSDKAQEC